jgi:hypothetical protein
MFLLFSSLLAPVALALPPSKGSDLTLTELQADPNTVPPYYGEWFEVYNNSGRPIDLNGVTISRDGESLTIPSDPPITVGAGDFFVFGASGERSSSATGFNGNVPVDYVYSYFADFNMSAPDDKITLTFGAILLDELDWDSSWDIVPNAAHQVQPNALGNEWANDLSWNWCPADAFIPISGMYGTPGAENDQCSAEYNIDNDGDGYSEFQGDCDDEHDDIYPGAVDGIASPYGVANDDADCDGIRDDGITDDDGDGWTEVDGDCDDEDDHTYPGAVEILDGIDNDCNACVDDVDYDHDGWTTCRLECDSDGDGDIDADDKPCYDCNEGTAGASDAELAQKATFNPDAPEIPYDGLDQNCDGLDECDVDSDGYTATSAARPCCDGYDCDDGSADIHPGAVENNANGLDDDCDGVVDLPDADGDGFTAEDGDCMDLGVDDADAAIAALSAQVHPGAREVCFDQVDNDCDGWIDNLPDCERVLSTATIKGGGLCSTGGAGAAWLGLVGLGMASRRRRLA